MEVHQLRYFVAVSEDGNFSRAAERMRVAQPSLSQQIQKLEAEIGQPLFDRLSRGVTPTEAGRRLLTFARKILTDLADARRCVDEYRDAVAGGVSVGIIPTIAPYVLRPVLAAFRTQHPQVKVEVLEDVTDSLVRALEDGEIDLAIVSTCRSGSAVHRELWLREPLLAALPESHRLAKRKRLSWEELPDEPFLMLHETHCLSRQIQRWCSRHGIRASAALPAVQLSTVIAMVAAGQGISLVPAMAVPLETGRGCAFVPLGDSAPQREINILRNPVRFRSKAAAAFSEVARETIGQAVPAETKNGT
ncbi:MAG TPA: LysR family transcriptional regulator [Chthoniobacteraceae bacterium]|jgi:LysR family hydrogen peroxide-inducible transcriptional activator|nr:LysR family transcriptional regulator [Chthoniobacter sp.]HEV7867314.1 LysR family transcriptional regulator [Chthoniobacteraceae bacterium]